ncbi:unnamed protein product, partial [Mesorhabditis belari]|uniref:ADP-ribosylhydrolase ARH3 n=1 Tax=Mesorhabditis belari TaxID=2138241 RepID=A0AAF3J3U3_9BILA
MSSDQIRGVLMGQLVGDALGARYEFEKAAEVEKMIKNDMKHANGDILPMLGIAHDGEMTLCLASGLLKYSGYNRGHMASAYVRWQQTDCLFIGRTTYYALKIVEALPKEWMGIWTDEDKERILEKVLQNVDLDKGRSQSNGFLMRIAPLPAFYHNQPFESWSYLVAEEVGLTHSHPATTDAALVYTKAIHQLINKTTPEEVYRNALSTATNPIVKKHLELAANQRAPFPYGDELSQTTRGDDIVMGYFGIALQLAFHELLHAKTFVEGLVNVVLIGGDADTNGCITAALLGARFGETAIPFEWRERVENADLRIKNENGITSIKEIVDKFGEIGKN